MTSGIVDPVMLYFLLASCFRKNSSSARVFSEAFETTETNIGLDGGGGGGGGGGVMVVAVMVVVMVAVVMVAVVMVHRNETLPLSRNVHTKHCGSRTKCT